MKIEASLLCRDFRGYWMKFEERLQLDVSRRRIQGWRATKPKNGASELVFLMRKDAIVSCEVFDSLRLVKICADIEVALQVFDAKSLTELKKGLGTNYGPSGVTRKALLASRKQASIKATGAAPIPSAAALRKPRAAASRAYERIMAMSVDQLGNDGGESTLANVGKRFITYKFV